MTESTVQAPPAELAAPRPAAAIRTEDLQKTYTASRGDVHAVRGISLDVAPGEFFGLLGPNGAGKSTTIGMLTTLILPTGGRAWVSGIDVVANPVGVKRTIGVVPQNNTLDMQLSVTENLEFRSRFFGLSRRDALRRADQLLTAFGLTDRRRAMATDLSGGQARRLMIARALVHRPDVLFLDEPTAGLDPQTRVNLWDTLQALHDEGQTILLTTHYMEEAEALCDRVAVVDHGLVLAAGTVDELKQGAGADTVITVRYDGDAAALDVLAALEERPEVSKVETEGDQVRVFARDPGTVLGELITAGGRAGLTVRDAAQLKPSLETVFLTLTGREIPRMTTTTPHPGAQRRGVFGRCRPGTHGRGHHRRARAAPHHVANVRGHAGPRVPGAQPQRPVHLHPVGGPAAAVGVRVHLRHAQDRRGRSVRGRRGPRRRDHLLHHPAARPDGLDAAHAGHPGHHVPAGHGVFLAAHDRGPGAGAGAAERARVEKIVAGAVQAFVGALIVIPIVLFVHASGQSPHVHVTNWFMLALILVAASMLTAALGLLLGTLMDPRKMQMLFAVILLPATMLGCVYYPWSALHSIRWLQIAVLFNPMVYMSEGLRAVLTPGVGHLAMWAILLVLIGGAASSATWVPGPSAAACSTSRCPRIARVQRSGRGPGVPEPRPPGQRPEPLAGPPRPPGPSARAGAVPAGAVRRRGRQRRTRG